VPQDFIGESVIMLPSIMIKFLDAHWQAFADEAFDHAMQEPQEGQPDAGFQTSPHDKGAGRSNRVGSAWSQLLGEIRRIPLLTPIEELELAEKREDGEYASNRLTGVKHGDPERPSLERRAREGASASLRLVECNLRLIVPIALKYRRPNLSIEDLFAEGYFGLARAVQTYDPRYGSRFSYYASVFIEGSINRFRANYSRLIALPVNKDELLARVKRMRRQLEGAHARSVIDAEVAAALGITVDEVEITSKSEKSVDSLDQVLPAGTSLENLVDTSLREMLAGDFDEHGELVAGVALSDLIADDTVTPFDDAVMRNMLPREMELVLQTLTPREQVILKLRWALGKGMRHLDRGYTLAEIGDELNMTPNRVRQIEAKALATLRLTPELRALRLFLE